MVTSCNIIVRRDEHERNSWSYLMPIHCISLPGTTLLHNAEAWDRAWQIESLRRVERCRKMSKDVERCRKLWNARSSTGILTFDPSRSIWAWHGFCISGVLLPSSSSEHIRIISDLYHFSSRSPRSGEIPERSWKDFLQITCTVHRSGPHKFVSFGLCQFGERSWYPIKQKCGN